MALETTLTRRERRRLDDRKDILAAALEVFGEKGFDGGTIQMIAERADLSVGTIYNFFDSKQDLYHELVGEFAASYEAKLDAAIRQGEDEREQVLNYIRVKGEFFRDHLEMAKLYFSETRGQDFTLSVGMDVKGRERFDRFRIRLAEVFRRGMEKGLFERENPFYLAVTLQSLTNAFIFLWLRDPRKHLYSENIDTIARLFFEGATPRK